jgi:HSP20 family molecular chaperone IbpA
MAMVKLPFLGLLPQLMSVPGRILAELPVPDRLELFGDRYRMPLEAHEEPGWFEVRAEIPGIDPTSDVEITAGESELFIKAQRVQRTETTGPSEFRYGDFARSVSLPNEANPLDITTTYEKGILTVWVPLSGAGRTMEQPVTVPVTY